MEIIIKGRCPNCQEKIVFHHIFERGNYKDDDVREMEDFVFNRVKNATFGAKADLNVQRPSFFKEVSSFFNEGTKSKRISKPAEYITNYFKGIEGKIKSIKNKKELLQIVKDLKKTKAVLSTNVEKEFNHQRSRILGIIKKRAEILKGDKRKS